MKLSINTIKPFKIARNISIEPESQNSKNVLVGEIFKKLNTDYFLTII